MKCYLLSLIAALLTSCEHQSSLKNAASESPPFSDVLITDIFESKGSSLPENNKKALALRYLFLDFLVSEKFTPLTAYGRDRLVRTVKNEATEKGSIRELLGAQLGNVDSIRKANAVFYGVDKKVAFCVVGGSDLIQDEYEGENARSKVKELTFLFEEHLRQLSDSLKSDGERTENWGKRAK